MHNLGTVIKFEILKQIRKPLFWVAIFAFPLMMLVVGGISYFSAYTADKQSSVAEEELKNSLTTVVVVDQSGLIEPNAFAGLDVKVIDNPETAMTEFKKSDNKNLALVIYPKDITTEPVETYTKIGKDEAATQQISMGFSALAKSALTASATAKVAPEVATILGGANININSAILDDQGEVYNPFDKMIIPGIFLVLLFVIFVLTGNQTLVATTEEKENRVAEMILTTIDAKALIVGKIIALVILGFIQIVALLTPMILIYLGGIKLNLIPPFLSSALSGAKVEFWPIFFGVNMLIWGFLLMTGFTILVGSLFPTAQDAAQFYTPIVLAMIIPVYFAGAIFTGAKSIVVQILTFFPLSAPFTLLMRNTAGNLNVTDGLIGLAILVVSTIIIMLIAVKAFRFGVFEYSGRLSLKQILNKSKRSDARA